MAKVIPERLPEGRGARPDEVAFASRVRTALPIDYTVWFTPGVERIRPAFVMMSKEIGVVGVDVYDWSSLDISTVSRGRVEIAGLGGQDPVGMLGQRLQGLKERLSGLSGRVPFTGMVVFPNLTRNEFEEADLPKYFGKVTAVTSDELADLELTTTLRKVGTPCDAQLLEQARSILYPETEFSKVKLVQDGERTARRAQRFRLDSDQEELARSIGDGLTVVSGPAGSGKSLVLCARARVLASAHPDWDILLLCFNRTLVPYLQSLVGAEFENVSIRTFHSWAHSHGMKIPWFSSDNPEQMEEAIERALGRERHKDTVDACLVDEGQDFLPGWLTLIWQAVRREKGGMSLAVDAAQCIYGDEIVSEDGPTKSVTHVQLRKCYRSTNSIGEFALRTVFGDHIKTEDGSQSSRIAFMPQFVSEGPPVQMVWAERWDGQADFIAYEVRRLVEARQATWRDIAVLFPQRGSMHKRTLKALEDAGIPVYTVGRDSESKDLLDLSENTVKHMTVHSAKGCEFPIVFLFGVEALKVGEDIVRDEEEGARKARVAYVGMTRAQDLLYLTYTRNNAIVDRGLKLGEWCEFANWPDDFEV